MQLACVTGSHFLIVHKLLSLSFSSLFPRRRDAPIKIVYLSKKPKTVYLGVSRKIRYLAFAEDTGASQDQHLVGVFVIDPPLSVFSDASSRVSLFSGKSLVPSSNNNFCRPPFPPSSFVFK